MPEDGVTGLRRALGTFDLTMIAIGSTIGSGIFLTPASIAAALQEPFWILTVWVLGGVMTLAGALTFAELSAMMPRAGGVYAFLSEAYGGLAGFLYGWAYFLVVNTGGIAALAIAFATYAGHFIPLDAAGTTAVAIAGILLVTVVNILGVKAGGVFAGIFTLLKLAAIAVIIAIGLAFGSQPLSAASLDAGNTPSGFAGALAVAMVGVLWSCGGWQHATFTAAEARNPERSLPIALGLGALAVVVVYLLTVLAYMRLLPVAEMAGSARLATDALATVVGQAGAGFVAGAIFISTFGTTGIYTLTAPRIYFAMAADGLFFRSVARIHPRYQTPVVAIALQSVWAILLIVLWGTFESLISYVVFTDWIFFGLAAFSVILFRRRAPDASRPYRVHGYPFTPLLFVAVSGWFVVSTLMERPAQALAGLGFLALGVPVYAFWKRSHQPSKAGT